MKAIDFRLTNTHDGQLSETERQAALSAAQAVLDSTGDADDAEYEAHVAAFRSWARWPESAELVVE